MHLWSSSEQLLLLSFSLEVQLWILTLVPLLNSLFQCVKKATLHLEFYIRERGRFCQQQDGWWVKVCRCGQKEVPLLRRTLASFGPVQLSALPHNVPVWTACWKSAHGRQIHRAQPCQKIMSMFLLMLLIWCATFRLVHCRLFDWKLLFGLWVTERAIIIVLLWWFPTWKKGLHDTKADA